MKREDLIKIIQDDEYGLLTQEITTEQVFVEIEAVDKEIEEYGRFLHVDKGEAR